jgi:hypothetical protein
MEKKRVVSLVLALALSTGLLSGCSSKTQTDISDETIAMGNVQNEEKVDIPVVDNTTYRIDSFEEVPESKEFDAGEHVFMIRYDLIDELGYQNAESINSLSLTVPEGYSILNMENFIGLGGKIGTCQTYGVDVWYINNEKVLVDPVYNESLEHYDYSQPGKVIEYSKTDENGLNK